MAFLFLRKRHFSMTSQLRHHYSVVQVFDRTFLKQFFSHPECQYDLCHEKLSKAVEIMVKVLVYSDTVTVY